MENIEFIKFCRALRGNSYNPPHRHRISSHLLPNLYKELETSFHAEIKGQNTTLQVDGWKDVQNDPTLGFAVACNGKDWLYKLEDTLGTRHTIENLGSLIGEVFPLSHACFFFSRPRPLLQEIKNLKTIGCQVSCCVTDNAYNMAGARREIVEMQQEEISNLQQQEATPEREKEIAELRQNALIDAYGCSAHLLNLWCVEPPLAFFLSISAGKM